jgi:hypothetical protein
MEGSLVAYKVFTNGSVLQASEINDNLMRQSVMVFSNAAARTAAITSPIEGMLTWLEDANRYETYNGSSWVPSFGMNLITSQTIGTAVSSITVSNVFSSVYDNYIISMSDVASSVSNAGISLRLGSNALNYNFGLHYVGYTSGTGTVSGVSATSLNYAAGTAGGSVFMNLLVNQPFLARNTFFSAPFMDTSAGGIISGILRDTSSYTDFTLTIGAGNVTGGRINVYGLKKA